MFQNIFLKNCWTFEQFCKFFCMFVLPLCLWHKKKVSFVFIFLCFWTFSFSLFLEYLFFPRFSFFIVLFWMYLFFEDSLWFDCSSSALYFLFLHTFLSFQKPRFSEQCPFLLSLFFTKKRKKRCFLLLPVFSTSLRKKFSLKICVDFFWNFRMFFFLLFTFTSPPPMQHVPFLNVCFSF